MIMKKKLIISASVFLISISVYLGTITLAKQNESNMEIDLEQLGIPVVHRTETKDLEILALNHKKDNQKSEDSINVKKDKEKSEQKSLKLQEENNKKSLEKKAQQEKELDISYETVETKGTIAYSTIEETTNQLDEGHISLLREGEDGAYKIIDKYKVVDGERTLISSEKVILKDAVNEIIQVGIRKEIDIKGNYDFSMAYETLAYVNELRAQAGLHRLNWNESLAHASQQRSIEIAQQFSHTRPNGSAWYTVDERIMSENIAYGQKSASAVIQSFNNSPVHRENMMSSKWDSMYVSLYIVDGVYYWVQHFA